MEKSENLSYWDQFKTVPKQFLKPIIGGRLKGMSDISPQWRYQVLTEVFGPCGKGWKFTIDKTWTEDSNIEGQLSAFATITLYVKYDDEWSDGIPGNGGSMFVTKERNGMHVSDECFKMAITDALSTACKMIGVAADVYLGVSDTKYPTNPQAEKPKKTEPDKPWLNKGEKLDKAIEYLKGGGKIANIEAKYSISKEIRQSLNAAMK